MNAPTGRKASVTVRVTAISASLRWNSLPIAVRQKTTRKKSKASSVQPRKLANTAARWSEELALMDIAGRGQATSLPHTWQAAEKTRKPLVYTRGSETWLRVCRWLPNRDGDGAGTR